MSIPASTRDLLPSEQRIVADMQQRRFCRYEFISIRGGELVLNPWPATVTAVRFASQDPATATIPAAEFQLNPFVPDRKDVVSRGRPIVFWQLGRDEAVG